jgi:hypothetical protein
MKKLLIIFLFLPLLAKAQFFGFPLAPTVGKDSIIIQFDTTQFQTGFGVVHITGMPSLQVLSATGGNLGTIGVNTVSTSTNNWNPSGGNTQYPNDGTTVGTVWSWLPNIMRETAFQLNTVYNASYPQVEITGLNPAATYNITITASVHTGISVGSCNTDYRILGASLNGPLTLDAQPGGTENTSGSQTFSGISPNSSGQFFIYVNIHTGGETACISAIRLIQQ